jgi:hypothetical protein
MHCFQGVWMHCGCSILMRVSGRFFMRCCLLPFCGSLCMHARQFSVGCTALLWMCAVASALQASDL